jgi:hypothetical protein
MAQYWVTDWQFPIDLLLKNLLLMLVILISLLDDVSFID